LIFVNKDNIFTVDGKVVSRICYNKNLLTGEFNILNKEILNSDVEFKNNSIMIMENEEIYIKYITIPRVSRDKAEKIVRDELNSYYGIQENITFTYSILKKNKTNMELGVFYINSKNLNDMNLKNIKALYLIQFCYAEYLKSIIKQDKYIFLFLHNSKLYTIYCDKGLIKYNYIFRNFKESSEEFKACLDYFINLNREIKHSFKVIYISGVKEEIIADIKKIYNFENLGKIEEDKLFKKVV